MQAVVRQADAGEDHRRTREAELGYDRDGAAGPGVPNLPPKRLLERLIEQVERRAVDVDLDRITAVMDAHVDVRPLRREPCHRLPQLPRDLLELLPGHEPQTHLG